MAIIPPSSPQKKDAVVALKDSRAQKVEYVEGTLRLFDSSGHVRKIPIVSVNPADPLTWSSWQRCLVLMSLCIFGIAGFGVVQSTPLFFANIIKEYEQETRGVGAHPSSFKHCTVQSEKYCKICKLSLPVYGNREFPFHSSFHDARSPGSLSFQQCSHTSGNYLECEIGRLHHSSSISVPPGTKL